MKLNLSPFQTFLFVLFCAILSDRALSATPTVEQAMNLTPVQTDVDYERPNESEVLKCTIKVETVDGKTGWVVRGAGGEILRRFIDSNNDNVVDLWCYFRNGIETYCDIDSNFDGIADQYRWLNAAGTRWGIDENGDHKIDRWRQASADASVYQRWALLVGVDDYAELEDLRYAGADVRALKQELLGRGFDPQNVFVVEDHAAETKYRPSKGNIERQLKLVMELADRNDLVLIAFSGHGVHVDGKSYLCPTDALLDDTDTLVGLDWVYERLKRCPAALKLMVVDACRDDPRLSGRRGPQSADVTSRFAADLERPPQGVVILNSCAPGQASMEEKQFGHGVFMHFLIEGLHGGADDNRDGRVSLGELSQFAGLQTKRYVARQFNGVQTPKLQGDLATDVLAFDLGMRGGLSVGRASSPSLGDAPTEGLASPPHDGAPHETFTNSIGIRFTLIPAGEFMMGSDESVADIEQAFGKQEWLRPEWIAGEHPKHRVRITKPFFLGVYEVTKEQFRRFVEAEDYRTDAEKDGKGGYGWNQKDKAFARKAEYTWQSWGVNQGDTSPVVNVSWNDAVAFCQWLSRKEGTSYRLPTEAEWEYACRGGTSTRFYNGDDPEGLVKIGNVSDGTAKETFTSWKYTVKAKDGFAFTCAVGQFRPNLFRLYDMTGNAAEWCADWYGEDYYANSPLDDPQGPAAGSLRVLRGGGWRNRPVYCRSADRNSDSPANRYYYIGFRVACVR